MSNDEARNNNVHQQEQDQQPSNKRGKVNFRTWVIFFISIFTLSAAFFYSYWDVRNSLKAHSIISSFKKGEEEMIALELGDKSSITAYIFKEMSSTSKFPKFDQLNSMSGGILKAGDIYTVLGKDKWNAFLANKTQNKDAFEATFQKRFITRGEVPATKEGKIRNLDKDEAKLT
jgi:hypothetical protein